MIRRMGWRLSIAAWVAVLASTPAAATFPGENGNIVYVSGKGGAPNDDSGADVYIKEPAQADGFALDTRSGQHRHPTWSPDLKRVAYALFDTGSNEKVWVHVIAGGTPDRVGQSSSDIRNDRPSWSPDGTRLAYESEVTADSKQLDIIITDISGGFPGQDVNLTNTPNFTEGKPVWSPDGKWIYFHRNLGLTDDASPDEDIMRIRADGTGIPQFIVNSATPEYQVALSPDGKRICYTRGAFGSANADIYVLTLGEFAPGDDLSETTLGAYNCAWSPDGKQIAYALGTFTGAALVVEPADDTGSPSPIVPDTANHFEGNPDWAPKRPARCDGRPATIAGTDGPDVLKGTTGRDIIVAHGGGDIVRGLGGNDLICGARGDDRLEGGNGDDTLLGGIGRDTCVGGRGADIKRSCER